MLLRYCERNSRTTAGSIPPNLVGKSVHQTGICNTIVNCVISKLFAELT
jgi:hypothetical protein